MTPEQVTRPPGPRGWRWFRAACAAGLVLHLTVPAAAAEEFFGLTNFWEFRLTFSAAAWDALEPAEPARPGLGMRGPGPPGGMDREYPWSAATFEGGGQGVTNLALRFKGNSSFNMSRGGLKRPFKLDFDRGAKGRTFFGHEELWLNNNLNDGAQFREALAYDAFRRAGIPAPRTAFAAVRLTIEGRCTNELLGLYTVVEAVEGDFLKAHCDTRKGLLVKPDRLPGLRYLGEDWPAYVERYDPKTDPNADDARRFIALARLVDQGDDATFARELPRHLDVTNLVRFVAVNAVLANYDSLIGTGHNYYLFQPRGDAPAVFIPWDLNEAFGGHPGAGPRRAQAGFSVLRPLGGPIRLVERVLARPDWAAAYRCELAATLTNVLATERVLADAARIAALTKAVVFAESPGAKAAFQRSALGEAVTAGSGGSQGTARTPEENRLGPDSRPDRFRDPPGPFSPGGPERGRGLPFGPSDEMPFADWVKLRADTVGDELAGVRTGTVPELRRGPGGPRPPGMRERGGPEGLR